jgi:hypothetical protein
MFDVEYSQGAEGVLQRKQFLPALTYAERQLPPQIVNLITLAGHRASIKMY